MRMGIGLGVGINRSNYAQGIFGAYATRVVADGGVVEAGACVDAVSGLLLSASLLLVPSGYKGGKLYAEIPTNGNGDLTWTRGSDGFRTNASGLIQRVPWNLLQRSEEFTNAVWVKITGSSVTANTANAPNGTLTADTLTFTSTADSRVEQTISGLNSGATYTFSVYLRVASGTFSMRLYGIDATSGTAITVTEEWQRFTITQLASSATRFPAIVGNGVAGSAFAWGAQLVEGTTAQTYLPTTDRLNFPRLSYMYGSCPAVLLEPQRTNLVLQSEDLTNGWSTEGLTVTANQTTAPDGNTTADLLQETAVTDVHRVYRSGITTVASTNYAFSFYVKKDTRRYVRLVLNQTTNAAIWAAAQFDLDNQTFTSGVGVGGGTFVSASISPAANGFYRITLVATATTTTTFAFLALSDGTAISSLDSRGCNTYVGNTSNRIWGWGAQLEAGAYPTTYIPTTSATATRVADSSRTTGRSSLIGQSEGTLFLDLYYLPLVNQARAISITETSNPLTNRLIININNTNNRVSVISRQSGSSTNGSMNETASTVLLSGRNKIALGYKSGDSVLYINGVSVATNTDSFTFSATLNDIFLMTSEISLVADNVGFVNSSALFTNRLTSTQLAQLTTL